MPRFQMHDEKKHSVRYKEVVPANGTETVGMIYVAKAALLQLTGGSTDWPAVLDGLNLSIPKTAPAAGVRPRTAAR